VVADVPGHGEKLTVAATKGFTERPITAPPTH
jgi:hypothetical protein